MLINEAAQKMLQEQVQHLVVTKGIRGGCAFGFVRLAAEFVAKDEAEEFTRNLFTHVDGN